MNRNTKSDAQNKADKIMNTLSRTAGIIRIAAFLCIAATVIYGGIKLLPVISRNLRFQRTAQITVDNEHYSAAMNSWRDGDYENAEVSFLLALEEVSSKYGEDDLITAQVHQKLGALYNETAHYADAVEQLNPAYLVFRKKLGDKNKLTIIAKCQISIADVHLGNYEQGFRNLNDAYQACDSYDVKAQIAQSIAQCYLGMSDFSGAGEWYDVLEELYSVIYADSVAGSATLLTFWNDRALLYADMGNAAAAVTCFEKAESYWLLSRDEPELTESVLADSGDKELANILINEATVLADVPGGAKRAADCAGKALIICRYRFGDHNAETARCYASISNVYNALQDKENEQFYLFKALEISLNTVGENSELTSSIYNSIGNLYMFDGDYETAVEYYERSIEIRRNILSYEHLLTAKTYENIANAKNRRGDYSGAEEAGRKAVEICEGLFGEDNMQTAGAYIELSRPLINTDRYEEALALLDKSLAICEKHAPEGSVTEAFARQYLMKMYVRQGEYDKALTAGTDSLKLFEKTQGENHSNTADAKLFLGDVYVFLGDAQNADSCYAQAFVIYEDLYSASAVHQSMDGRIRNLIALERVEADRLNHQEIAERIAVISEDVTDAQVLERYQAWGFE